MTKLLDDQQIRAAILGSQAERQALFAWLYRDSGWRNWVGRHVQENGGDGPASDDIFQETLILFDRNLREGRFAGESNLKTYFFGIAKQYWFNRQRTRRNLLPVEQNTNLLSEAASPENEVLENERREAVAMVIAALDEHCRKVLALYKLSLTNEEIARELQLSSPELAKKYSYRCRKKFRAFVLERPQLIDLLNIKIGYGKRPGSF